MQCAVGVGSTSGCSASGDGEDLTVEVSDLGPNTPVTLRTQLDMRQPPVGNKRLWAQPLDSVLGTSLPVLLIILGLAALAAWAGSRAAASAKEKTPPFPLMYAPPEGIGPAQGAYLLTEKVQRHGFVASLMESGEKGVTHLALQDKSWTVEGLQKADGVVDDVTRSVLSSLSIGGGGGSFTAKRTSVAAGKKLTSALEAYESATKSWASSTGLIKSSGLGAMGGFLVVVSFLAAFVLPLANAAVPLSVFALVPGLFGIFAIGLLKPGLEHGPHSGRPRPVVQDRRLPPDPVDTVGGGAVRLLRPQGALHRLPSVGGRVRLRRRLGGQVPHRGGRGAAAADVRLQCRRRLDHQHWGTGDMVSHIVTDFDSTLDSAVASYEATQRSSSSGGGSGFSGGGGGGFSGGGGGGGGGGGSW